MRFTPNNEKPGIVPPDHIFRSIQPAIKEQVAKWVEEAIAASCNFVKDNRSGNSGAILFKNYEGNQLQRMLRFKDAYHKAGYLHQPFGQIAEYAVACALKDPRIKEWVTPLRWNSKDRKRSGSPPQGAGPQILGVYLKP